MSLFMTDRFQRHTALAAKNATRKSASSIIYTMLLD